MTGGGDQGWRGGRRRRTPDSQEEAQPSWKKSRHVVAASGRKRLRRRVLIPVLLLSVLVAIAIYIWRGARYVHTHFVLLDLITGSMDFDAAAVPVFPENPTQRFSTRRVTHSRQPTLAFYESPAESVTSDIDRANAVVIYLQTLVLPGADGELQCLIRNSTPDLDVSSRHESLQKLKSALVTFHERNPETGIVLLIDTPELSADWRLGFVRSAILRELEDWTTQIPRLVVIAACPDDQSIAACGPGGNGTTVFGHFAASGFSRLADADANNELSVVEYCEYVVQQTNDWVARNRDPSGQIIRVVPALDQIRQQSQQSPGLNFVLMKDLPDADAAVPFAADTAFQGDLGRQWQMRDDLYQHRAYRWHPLLWRAANDHLRRSENAFINGHSEIAGRELQRAKDLLARLQAICVDVCPEQNQLLVNRDLSFRWFSELPSAPRVMKLWEQVSAVTDSETGFSAAEEILDKHLNAFPFQQIGLQTPSASVRKQILDRRRNAEVAAAQLFGSADRMRVTIGNAERQLLTAEDLMFVRPAPADTTAESTDTLFAAIEESAVTLSEADATCCRVLEIVPGLTRWCALESSQLSTDARSTWQELLLQNHADVEMTPGLRDQLLARLETLPTASGTGVEAAAVQLRTAVFRLMVNARGLQKSLRIAEPAPGFTTESLISVTDSASDWNAQTTESLLSVLNLMDQFCQELIRLDSQTPIEQVRTYRLLRSALVMDTIPANTRIRLLERLIRWDGKLKESTAENGLSDDSDRDPMQLQASASTLRDADSILWMLQMMNLLDAEPDKASPASSVWKTAAALIRETSDGDLREKLSQFGSIVRSIWKDNRSLVKDSVLSAGPEALELLRVADRRSRLMSGFDAELEVARVPAEKLLLLNRFHYCLLHIDRLLLSQWVDPADRKPYATNGWYARVLRAWLAAATAAADSLQAGSSMPAGSLKQLLDERQAKLLSTEGLQLLTVPLVSGVELSDQNISRKTAGIEIRHENPADQDGVASLLVTSQTADTASNAVRVDNNGQALPLRDKVPAAELMITRLGNPGTEGCQSISLQTSVFFRGRQWQSEERLRVNPCAAAEFRITRMARPATAGLTLTGSDPRPITFILDWSGSMKEPLTSQQGTRRADVALETLSDLIRDPLLTETQVNLDIFGHRIKYNPDTQKDEHNEPYRTIFRKPIPNSLNALTDIETELKNLRMNENGIQTFNRTLENLKRLEPFGITPLASAITDALNNPDRRSGIVIVVTDGEPSDVGVAVNRDPERQKAMQVNNDRRKELLLRAMASNPAARVVIVAFDLANRDAERRALNQIFTVECGIAVIDAVDKGQLLQKILESLDPGKYLVTQLNSGTQADAALNNRITGLMPGRDYVVSFGQISTPPNAPIRLSRGDDLRINLDQQRQRMIFKRDVASQMRANAVPTAAMDLPSMLRAVGPARFVDVGTVGSVPLADVELILMLDHQQESLPVRQPAEIEFHVTARGAAFRSTSIRERFSSEYGAPAWQLEIDGWPKEHDILVDAFWKMDLTPAETALSWEQLRSADRPETSLRIGGNGGSLPDALVWTRLLEDGTLQIRLDRVVGIPYSPENLPEDIRVQIGNRDVREQNATFLPDEVNTSLSRTESGSAIFEFRGNFSLEDLRSREFAFTSRQARKSGAFQLTEPLLIDKRR